MSNYAKVVQGKVVNTIVADASFFDTYVDTSPGKWVEGTTARKNNPSKNFTYDKAEDVFYAPQPYPSWTLNKTSWQWEAPVTYPSDGKQYDWDEDSKSWKES